VAKDCFDQATKHGLKPIYFKAINGNFASHHYEKCQIVPKKKMKKGRLGVIGCFFSHYYLWLECVKTNTPLVILEHDGYILKSFDEKILDTFNDVLKLDRLDPYSKSYNEDIQVELHLPITIEKYKNQSGKNPDKIGTGNYFKGAYAYIIKPCAATKLINHIKEHGHVTADQQIGDWIVDTQTTVPSLARLHPFYSVDDNIKTASLTKNLKII
jgi:GR25 family glycosyltransferase involved in LPS biosynthesis